jgi:hypothetical protein
MARRTALKRSAFEPHKLSCPSRPRTSWEGCGPSRSACNLPSVAAIGGSPACRGGEHVGELQHCLRPPSALIVCTQGRTSLLESSGHAFRCWRDARRCTTAYRLSTALQMVLQTAQPQVRVCGSLRPGWTLALGSHPPRKCLPEARSYLCGFNASSTASFVARRRHDDPLTALETR